MKAVWKAISGHFSDLWGAWDWFWFSPADPVVLCAIRVLTGALLFWTHLVWSFDLSGFLGPEGWLAPELIAQKQAGRFVFSLFDWIGPAWLLWTVHVLYLVVCLMLMFGLFSRVVAVLAFLGALSYVEHVTPGAFFGLDKINCLLAMYVMLGPCGARYSVDRLRAERRGDEEPGAGAEPSISANIAIRLMQLHLCVVYLFSGLGKLQGELWWNGRAVWFSVANPEYRSLDMTWLANHLWLVDALTHATVLWELFYCWAIWNPLLRPWVLLGAIGIHGFIGLGMGMPEFALSMLVANMAFLAPVFIEGLFDRPARWASALFRPRKAAAEA
ncbi:Vitamin K-dependent gamma-carboxylase [Pseudobythopirellula maris]|uniref:Vitamin K-dependent gamma-carboxylase n=1 Tax=Pseudobythopirellula maris TaxID=2527991 RepID=A0A5C5ZHY5_9BACT|nr:HTTM domain-containing protein [Pseudobythopirellula maris]TWT86798.1 Vitamin K-dependent gamma-carboxylase [Pseudobythopirellula maris]